MRRDQDDILKTVLQWKPSEKISGGKPRKRLVDIKRIEDLEKIVVQQRIMFVYGVEYSLRSINMPAEG